jgi:sugar phosphate isomerase/epimerase
MYPAYNRHLTDGRVQWPEAAQLAASVGFPGVDVYTVTAMRDGLDTTVQILAQHQLLPAAMDFPVEFRQDEETFQKGLRLLPEAASFAAALGCPRMSAHVPASSDKPKPEQRKIYLDRLRACAEVLARSNVRVGLEFLGPLHLRKARQHEFIWKMDEMLGFAEECGPNIGLLLDSWHWHHSGATVDDILTAGRERIVHVHLNDSAHLPPEEVRDNERLLPGEGVIDLRGFLQALKTIGYRDALSVEVFGRDPKVSLESALRVMRDAGVTG